MAAVMLEDWEKALCAAEKKIATAPSAITGLEIIFQVIRGFSDTYRIVWDTIQSAKEYRSIRLKYHKMLIDQLNDQIRPLGMRFGFLYDVTVPHFLSEVLLTGASHPQGRFCYLSPCLKRIVGEA